MYTEALKLQENFISSRFHLGIMFHKTNRFQEALKCFGKVLMKIPNDKTVYITRGVVYQDMGNNNMAIKDFSKAIELDPKSSEAHYRRGLSKLLNKNYHDAIDDFRKSGDFEITGHNNRNAGISDGLAQCFHALKDYDQAIGYFDAACDQDETNTDFLMHRAHCYYDQKHYDKAIHDLLKGLSIVNYDPMLYYRLGITYYADKQYKQAIKSLKQSLLNKPYQSYEPDIYYNIGLAYCNLEKYEKSIYPFSKSIEMVPSEINYIHERAKAYQMIEDHEKAVLDFDVVIQKNPRNSHAFFRRAFSHKSLGQFN